MKKLYDSSEIRFALFWIILYTAGIGSLRSLGDDSIYLSGGMLLISVLMYLFVRRYHLEEKYGLTGWAKNSAELLWFIPLWIVTTGNLWGGISPAYPMPGLLYAILCMALVGFAEELIFRGFLFKAMLKDGSPRTAIIISSVTFGIGHIVNLFNGHELMETLSQVSGAIAMGLIFTMVFYKGGSLLPGIISHSLIDVFSKLSAPKSPVLDTVYILVILLTAVFYCRGLTKLKTGDTC